MSRAVKRQTPGKSQRKGPPPAPPKVAANKQPGRRAGIAAWRPRFVTDIFSELRKVTWPTREETMHLTVVVLIVAIMMGAFLGGLDAGFGWIVDHSLLDRNLFDSLFG